MALIEINPETFGQGGANVVPQSSGGSPNLGAVIAAQREDAFFPRFDWSTVVSPVASDLATLVDLVNAITGATYDLSPVGAKFFGARHHQPLATAALAEEYMHSQCNGLKAMLVNTASVDYSALSAVPDATDLATAIVLANALRTALGLS